MLHITLHMEGEAGTEWHGEKADGHGLAGVVGRNALTGFGALLLLVIVTLVWGHDVHGQAVALDLGDYVPEGQSTAHVLFLTIFRFKTEQGVDHGQWNALLARFQQIAFVFTPAAVVAPLAGGQFPRCLAQYALDPSAGQIRQAVGVEESKAVFQGVFVPEAGAEGCYRKRVNGQTIFHRSNSMKSTLPLCQCFHQNLVPLWTCNGQCRGGCGGRISLVAQCSKGAGSARAQRPSSASHTMPIQHIGNFTTSPASSL